MNRRTPLALLALLLGSGGGGAKYKIDDVSLAQVPVTEKQAIFAAQNEVVVAQSEQQKAKADLEAVGRDRDIASKEEEQARLEMQKVKLEVEVAKKSNEPAKVAAAAQSQTVADVGQKVAGAKVYWLEQVKQLRQAEIDAAEERVALAQAKVELEKALLAQAKGIKPTPDFNLDNFKKEHSKRDLACSKAKRAVDEAKAEADKRLKAHDELKLQHTQLKVQANPPAK